jgi:hypothetical protein
LEITAALSGDPTAAWRLELLGTDGVNFSIQIDGGGFFAVSPSLPDLTPFLHIRPVGQANRVSLSVEQAHMGTLRINDEVAWRGGVPTAHTGRLIADGGKSGKASVNVMQAAVYGSR